MVDPLTGKTVNAQLGSDRRLKTIYDTNTRSAYQEGRWERSQESTAHPYLMYRVGPSRHHRQEHLDWDGLVLPKDDPWWNSHYPPNGWGCKCWTMAVSEARKERLEKSGVTVPPTHDGQPGYTVPVKTQAPPTRYRWYENERKGIIERIPEGITPGFNWNVGQGGRRVPAIQQTIRKIREETPEQYDEVIKSLTNNRITREDYDGFITKSLDKELDMHQTMPVCIFDQKILRGLRKEGLSLEEQNIVTLDSGLVNAGKFAGRHVRQGNAPTVDDWKNLMDYFLGASVYLENDKSMLIFLRKTSESRYVKIAVDLSLRNKAHKGTALLLPRVDSMYQLDISTEIGRGIDEYNRIMELKKIR
jgi:hypothetical protein